MLDNRHVYVLLMMINLKLTDRWRFGLLDVGVGAKVCFHFHVLLVLVCRSFRVEHMAITVYFAIGFAHEIIVFHVESLR